MKRATLPLIIGIFLGVVGTMLALPALERFRERRIVKSLIDDFGLPELPPEAKVRYAYSRSHPFTREWYGFEFQTTREQAQLWKDEADKLDPKKMRWKGYGADVDFDCTLRSENYLPPDGHCIEVQMSMSTK